MVCMWLIVRLGLSSSSASIVTDLQGQTEKGNRTDKTDSPSYHRHRLDSTTGAHWGEISLCNNDVVKQKSAHASGALSFCASTI